jgi:hypothetical protein
MLELKKAADEILVQLQGDKPTMAFDPATIMIIIEALKILLPLVLEWCDKEPEEVPELAEGVLEPESFLERTRRWWAKRVLINELGRKQYNQAGGEALLDAVCRRSVTTDPQRIARLYGELAD